MLVRGSPDQQPFGGHARWADVSAGSEGRHRRLHGPTCCICTAGAAAHAAQAARGASLHRPAKARLLPKGWAAC